MLVHWSFLLFYLFLILIPYLSSVSTWTVHYLWKAALLYLQGKCLRLLVPVEGLALTELMQKHRYQTGFALCCRVSILFWALSHPAYCKEHWFSSVLLQGAYSKLLLRCWSEIQFASLSVPLSLWIEWGEYFIHFCFALCQTELIDCDSIEQTLRRQRTLAEVRTKKKGSSWCCVCSAKSVEQTCLQGLSSLQVISIKGWGFFYQALTTA